MSKILERQASTKRGLRARRTGITMDHSVGIHPCPRPLLRMALWAILCCSLPSGQSFSPFCLSSPTYPPAGRKPFQSCGRISTTTGSSSTSILSSLPDDNDADTQSNNNNNNNNNGIRFLGRGPHAIIRPGVVLIAPPDEFHHFYRQSAIFIYAMGEDETYNQTYVVRGAIIDHPTPFTLDEMVDTDQVNLNLPAQEEESPGNNVGKKNPLSENLIYRGGDRGEDSLFLLHNQPSVGSGSMIGTSGIFQGGLQDALTACRDGKAAPDDFKFYFNYCEFTEDQLEQMLEDDPWMSAEIPSHMILNAEWDRGDCWKQLRNALRDHHPQQDV